MNNEERFGIVSDTKVTDLTGQINNTNSLKELIKSNGLPRNNENAKLKPDVSWLIEGII